MGILEQWKLDKEDDVIVAALTWHRNETRSMAIEDLFWYSAGE